MAKYRRNAWMRSYQPITATEAKRVVRLRYVTLESLALSAESTRLLCGAWAVPRVHHFTKKMWLDR